MTELSINQLIDADAIDVSNVRRVLDALREARAVLESIHASDRASLERDIEDVGMLLTKWNEDG